MRMFPSRPADQRNMSLILFDFPCKIIYNDSIIQGFFRPERIERLIVKAFLIFPTLLPAAALFFLIGTLQATETSQTPPATQPPITEKQLKSAANNSLWRLKHAVDKEGFYAARIALNVWRSNALDAGVFDQAEYDAYKKKIYEKSIQNSRQCFEYAIQHENVTDARICLHTWKAHSEEMGTFDAELYEGMQKKLK